MALIKFGGGVIQMTGSIAGNTFARNRYGNYVRARTKPINPNSGRQQTIRSIITTLTVLWSQTLTSAQRTAWNLYGSSVAMKNKLGETTYLTGFNHYIRSNSPRLHAGVALVNAGPTIFELPDADPTFAITASEGGPSISYTFDNALAWANEVGGYMFKYQGSPQNPQRNFFDGPWRYHGKIEGAVIPPTSPDVELDPPFAVTETQRQWCYARIAMADGRLSEKFRADCFCAA